MLIRLSDICEYTQSCTCKCIDYGTLSQQNPRILKYHFPICTGKNSINPHNSHTLYTFFLCFTENVKIKLNNAIIKVTKLIICMHVHLFEFKENFIKTMSMCPSTVL